MLETKALTYSLRDKHLIENISLKFSPGALYGILGPNGSGKSTFLKTLAGIWTPTSGQVLWHGEDLHQKKRLEISKIISLVPQNPQLYFDLSVSEIVAMGRYSHGTFFKGNQQQELDIIEKSLLIVDGWHLRDRQISQLSNGERQRIYIARALATESPILLLDEPTTSLDIRHRLEIERLLQELVSHGKIIIMTNHDLTTLEHYCTQIAILNQGQCIAAGSLSEIFSEKLLFEVFGVRESPAPRMRFFHI